MATLEEPIVEPLSALLSSHTDGSSSASDGGMDYAADDALQRIVKDPGDLA